MTNFRKSVPKPTVVGAGAPNPKKGLVSVIFASDVLSFPGRDANGVKMVGNIILKPGTKVHTLYETPTSQKASHSIEGDEDAEQFKSKFEGTHPGDSIEINEFVQNALGEGIIVLYGTACGIGPKKVLGDPCNPLKLKGEFTDDKDGVKHTLNFEQLQGDSKIPGFYYGTLSYDGNFTVADAAAMIINPVNGNVYQLPATPVEVKVGIATMTLPHGEVVSFIGSGGAGPTVLEGGALTGVTVLLKNDTDWIALKDAVINLQVMDAGTIIYLIEVSRG